MILGTILKPFLIVKPCLEPFFFFISKSPNKNLLLDSKMFSTSLLENCFNVLFYIKIVLTNLWTRIFYVCPLVNDETRFLL